MWCWWMAAVGAFPVDDAQLAQMTEELMPEVAAIAGRDFVHTPRVALLTARELTERLAEPAPLPRALYGADAPTSNPQVAHALGVVAPHLDGFALVEDALAERAEHYRLP